VALGVGLLIGTGRERAMTDPKGPADAGVRTFSLAALGGAVAIACGGVMLLAVQAVAAPSP